MKKVANGRPDPGLDWGKRANASRAALVGVLCLLLACCAPVGPNYAPPKEDAPPTWNSDLQDGLTGSQADLQTLASWWEVLDDPELTELIAEAVQDNLDLKQAQARVRQARALRGVSQARLFPTVDAVGAVEVARDSESVTGSSSVNELYTAGFDAGWEVDVFGGLRRSIEAADAELQASEAELRDILISLTAEVGVNYVDVRTFQNRLAVAKANLSSQENTYGFIRSRHEAGLINRLAVEQARYNLEDTRSKIPALETGLEAAKNRLAVLLGKAPGQVHERLEKAKPAPAPPLSVAVGVPAEALRRRPDIRQAERQLAAQSARVGVATADLYPKFRLLGSIGLEAAHVGDLVDATSIVGGVLPSFSWNIFDAGAIRRNIEAQSALQEQFLLAYEGTVLNALEEVENALTGYAQEQYRKKSLREAVDAAQEAVALSQDLYKAGLINFDSVLDAQRSLLDFQDQLAVSEGLVVARLIALYKALGGGWSPLASLPESVRTESGQ